MPRMRASSNGAASSAPAGYFPAWARSVKDVAAHWGVDPTRGLCAEQVAAQRAAFGFNELDKEDAKPLWKLVLEQFDDPLVKARSSGARNVCRKRSPRVHVLLCAYGRAPRRARVRCSTRAICPPSGHALTAWFARADLARRCMRVAGDQLAGGT